MSQLIKLLNSKCQEIVDLHSTEAVTNRVQKDLFLEVISTGKQILEVNEEDDQDEVELFKQNLKEYQWAEELKQYALLLRDVFFRTFKSSFVPGALGDLNLVAATLDRASSNLINELKHIDGLTSIETGLVESWKHQYSPIETILEQIGAIEDQIDSISKESEPLKDVERDILFYKTELSHAYDESLKILEKVKLNITEVKEGVANVTEEKEASNLNTVISTIDQVYASIDEMRGDTDINDKHFQSETSINVPVDIHQGNLITKQIDFNKQVNTWVESEIFPDLLEIERELQQLEYSALLKLVNLKNRLSVIDNNPELFEEVSDIQFEKPLDAILESADLLYQKILDKNTVASKKIGESLSAQRVFDKEQFYLTTPTRVLINDYQKEGNRWVNSLPLQRIKTWYNNFFDTYIAGGDDGITIENKQVKLIDFIKSKSLDGIDKFSHSLFLNKGYLGQTFYQSRSKFQILFNKIIANWEDGFAASMLIHGKRLSGKSTLLEAISNRSNSHDYIDLKPNTQITYKGHKIDVGVSFSEIFKSLDKYTIGEKVVVTIDDIELWRSDEEDYLNNIRHLLQSISRLQKRYCFVVTTNNLMKQELDSFLQFSNAFSSIFDASEAAVEDIVQIIETRAEASKKEADAEENNNRELILDIAKRQQGNIGASLIEYTRKSKKESSSIDNYLFMKFLQDHRSVLEYVMKWGSISESEISGFRNPKMIELVNASVRRLVSMKILDRQVDRSLIIPAHLLDEVEISLERYSPLNPN